MSRPDSTTNDATAFLSCLATRRPAQRRSEATCINDPNIRLRLPTVPRGDRQPERHRRCACSEQHLIEPATRSVRKPRSLFRVCQTVCAEGWSV